MHSFDLDAYLDRVRFAGARRPTFDTLFELHQRHPATVAFEALDVLAGHPIDLDPEQVDAKLIARRRGGYCFEQNNLFKRALEALGFRVTALLARSRWNRPPDVLGPRTHMALVVHLGEGDWLADVGFGGCMMTAPVRLGAGEEERRGFEPHRLAAIEAGLQLQVQRAEGWTPVYDTDLAPQLDADFLTPNWWVSTHPDSPFRHQLLVTKTADEVRHTLVENRLIVRPRGGAARQEVLDAEGIRATLTDVFGLVWEAEWKAVVAAAVLRGAAMSAAT